MKSSICTEILEYKLTKIDEQKRMLRDIIDTNRSNISILYDDEFTEKYIYDIIIHFTDGNIILINKNSSKRALDIKFKKYIALFPLNVEQEQVLNTFNTEKEETIHQYTIFAGSNREFILSKSKYSI